MKVLVVDDSAFIREVHCRHLERFGHESIEASCGTAAIEAFDQQRPDAVLIDLLMPDMDGMDVVREMRKRDPSARIIICSSDTQRSRQREAADLGVVAFVAKPAAADRLKAALDDAAKNH